MTAMGELERAAQAVVDAWHRGEPEPPESERMAALEQALPIVRSKQPVITLEMTIAAAVEALKAIRESPRAGNYLANAVAMSIQEALERADVEAPK